MENIQEKIVQGDIYALFSICDSKDLNPIVNILLDKLNNGLDINDIYKKYKPDHMKYYQLIADELRSYGGNSFVNRIKDYPSYNELLRMVCSKLGCPFIEGDICKSEETLIDLFCQDSIDILNNDNWQEISVRASLKAIQNLSVMKEVGKGTALTALGGLLSGPVALGVLSWKLAGPAYKVIIPCVVYIAFLRKKKLIEWKKNTILIDAQSSITNKEFSIIDQDNGSEVLTLFKINGVENNEWNVGNDKNEINQLNSLLQLVPSLIVKNHVDTTDYYKVVIPKGMQLMKKKSGDVFCANLARVTDPKKTARHADIVPPDQLKKIMNINAIFNVASVIVAQKHLADINKKLNDIKKGIEEINRFQKNERRTQLIGSIQYCIQIASSIFNDELEDEYLYQLETIERDTIRIQEHLLLDLQYEQKRISSFVDNEWFGSEQITAEIFQRQQTIKNLYEELTLSIRLRACAWQLLCKFPQRELRKEARLNDIKNMLVALSEEGNIIKQTIHLIRDKIESITSFWNSTATLTQRKLMLIEENKKLNQFIISKKQEIEKELQQNSLHKEYKTTEILLKVTDGKLESYQ